MTVDGTLSTSERRVGRENHGERYVRGRERVDGMIFNDTVMAKERASRKGGGAEDREASRRRDIRLGWVAGQPATRTRLWGVRGARVGLYCVAEAARGGDG